MLDLIIMVLGLLWVFNNVAALCLGDDILEDMTFFGVIYYLPAFIILELKYLF